MFLSSVPIKRHRNTPVDNATGNGRLGGIALGRAQLYDVVRRHPVRGQRHCCQRSPTLHTPMPFSSVCLVYISAFANFRRSYSSCQVLTIADREEELIYPAQPIWSFTGISAQ